MYSWVEPLTKNLMGRKKESVPADSDNRKSTGIIQCNCSGGPDLSSLNDDLNTIRGLYMMEPG